MPSDTSELRQPLTILRADPKRGRNLSELLGKGSCGRKRVLTPFWLSRKRVLTPFRFGAASAAHSLLPRGFWFLCAGFHLASCSCCCSSPSPHPPTLSQCSGVAVFSEALGVLIADQRSFWRSPRMVTLQVSRALLKRTNRTGSGFRSPRRQVLISTSLRFHPRPAGLVDASTLLPLLLRSPTSR